MLNLLEAIRMCPSLFESLFVYKDDLNNINKFLEFDDSVDEKLKQYLLIFIERANPETKKDFLFFATGSYYLPVLKSIVIKSKNSDAIFSCVCSLYVIIPSNIISQGQFNELMSSAIDNKNLKKSFTVV